MGALDPEVDFPRTIRTDKTIKKLDRKAKAKRKPENDLFGDGKKKMKLDENGKKPVKASKNKTENVVWQTKVTYDVLTEGVMGLGIIIEIAEDHIVLEACDNCRVRLPATQISKLLTNILKEGKETLEDFFEIGQMIPFRVTKKSIKDEKTGRTAFPEVTCDPSKLNSHLVPSTLFVGLVIHSIVESIEEKGCVLDIGLMSMKGFLPKEKFPNFEIKVGKAIIIRIESSTSRVLTVSAFAEQDVLSSEACDKLQMNYLMPGTIVECEPEDSGSKASGVFVKLGNGVRAFIARRHLPPRLRTDTSKLVKTIRGVVMFCRQNSNLLIISAHPDIIALSKPEKRRNFDGLEIGDKVKCHVIDVIPNKYRVVFSLPNGADGKPSLITATASKDNLEGAEQCEKIYKLGSEHDCRVLDFHYSERSILVATKKEILKQKMVSFKDAVPGELVTAKVKKVTSNGIFVTLFKTVHGYMPMRLLSDKAVSIQKTYPIGKEFKCRIWQVDLDRKQVIISAKQSLIEHNGVKINEYDEKFVGKTSIGVVTKVFDKGSMLVTFYNGVCGILPTKEAAKLNKSSIEGKTVQVKVQSVDAENKKIMLLTDDDRNSSEVTEDKKLPAKETVKKQNEEKLEEEEKNISKKAIKNFAIYTGTISGTWSHEDIGSFYCVKVDLPHGNIGRLHISEFPEKFADQEDTTKIMKSFLQEFNHKRVTVRAIGFADITLNDIKRRIVDLTMMQWKLCFPKIREKQLGYKQKYTKQMILTCYSTPENDTANIKVEINPIAFGIIPREQFTDNTLKNETVEGGIVNVADQNCVIKNVVVTGCSKKKNRFSLHLKLTAPLPETKRKEVAHTKETRNNFEFGQLVAGRVINVNYSTFGVAVSLSTGQQAILGPTAISAKYDLVQKFLKKFHKGELYHFYSLRQDEHPRRLFVITEGRYKQYTKDPNSQNPVALMRTFEEVSNNVGKEVYGFLCFNSGPSYSLVEIAPGIRGIIKKTETTKNLPLNTVLAVIIKEVDIEKKRVLLHFQKVVQSGSVQKETVKNEIVAKELKSRANTKATDCGEKMEIEDPGFNWDNAGFTPDELVGRIESKAEGKSEKAKQELKEAAVEDKQEKKDFDQLLKKDPTSATIWIEYMSFFLEQGDIEKARATAERALTVMDHREEEEIFNLWTAYLNMEVEYGDEVSATEIFQRACGSANGLKVHKTMAAILNENGKIEQADEIFKAMIRKFRASSDDVWFLYAEHLMSTERAQEGRDLLQRALASVPQQRHPQLISRFAQLEYTKGDAERGRTLFESLVSACPKKRDIWMVYADLTITYNGIEAARQVLERACNLPFNSHKIRPIFKKWMEFEDKYGDEKSKNLVMSRAGRFLNEKNQDVE